MNILKNLIPCFVINLLVWLSPVFALSAPIDDFLVSLEGEAKKADPSFTGFSAQRGEALFLRDFPHPDEPTVRSCATCHTRDLTQKGSHYKSGKIIEPLSPSANKSRLGTVKKVKKWFKRNCKWVAQRTCTPQEKGDFITFLKAF